MQRAMRTLLPALLLVTAVGAAAYGLQAATLPQPSEGQLVAADATRWLTQYRRSTGVQQLAGEKPLRGSCIDGWYHFAVDGPLQRGSALHLADGALVLILDGQLGLLGRDRDSRGPFEPLAQLELAGCPRVLATRIGAVLGVQGRVELTRTSIFAEPALALRLRAGPAALVLYLTATDHRPFAIHVTAPGVRGLGWFRLGALGEQKLDGTQRALP